MWSFFLEKSYDANSVTVCGFLQTSDLGRKANLTLNKCLSWEKNFLQVKTQARQFLKDEQWSIKSNGYKF